ncbi:xylulose 5-phosphate 3-epimerase [Pseudomonas aeruginosa]|nr:xylulose 5-phosphate 3-epimerase [Pseudomonas aeruginosa]ELQ7349746.1 xylulose 5-phosphate 3-epimerase [Pseudomonas aeruginosa]MBH3517163.1 xylulose 5-phosphate 3-epimerase [Pseudomonas aeruginosa]MBH3738883.1 xylulose 5-phosphate 3-epimerase [Pseudomonas aeruginosa]MBI8751135.1 xylulose 5-phosphate 3-epimerase [Pseudomonas aeruginosa]
MNHELPWVAERVRVFRESDPEFARWARGHGPITHNDLTQLRVHDLAQVLVAEGKASDTTAVYRTLWSADRLAVAGMWLTVHMTYADRVYPDGREMRAEDFKETPEGHTGGALNIVPAYVGYLAANALSGLTRGWLMGQGHCVAGIDACNLLVGNMTPRHAERYDRSESGLTRFARDFYSYAIDAQGRPASPLGSHVGPNTAGGLSEGGYLGFAELQYVHMPLPGERLVVFLSDGAFEEQRGSDWAPRWWRAEDSGFVAPFMILNGRRIEQRSTMQQQGGREWFHQHLRLNGFDPMEIDGTDPAAFAWAVHAMEERLSACAAGVSQGTVQYPVPLHYTIAEAPKGFGFPGAGTNAAHNLPLEGNPRVDQIALQQFNEGARALFVPSHELDEAVALLRRHEVQHRPLERDHALAHRQVAAPRLPVPQWHVAGQGEVSPMAALDGAFAALVQANPQLRPRVGNPDELRSNRMGQTLDLLKHRVFTPEPGLAEAVDGAVITALNEEAVVSAALGNKGGINLVVSYEAFAVKMLGALRQEMLFARHQAQAGTPPGWLSVVTVATSHTWENGKNEQSHQDPTLAEALLGEMSDTSRVLFPVDANSAVAALRAAYASHGQFWTLVVPKRAVASQLSAEQAERLVDQGGWVVKPCDAPDVLLVAIGAYQLQQALLAAQRLEAAGHRTAVTCVIEPGRFRAPRDEREQDFVAGDQALRALFPETAAVRVIVSHMRPEPTLGLMRRIDTGARQTRALGYQARGGTLDVAGMLFANRCTWAHVAAEAAQGLGVDPQSLLSAEEWAAVQGRGDPRVITVSA